MTTTRKKKLEKATQNNPYINYDALEGLADDADKLHDIKAIFDMEGGKILVDALIADVVSSVDRLASGYSELTHDQFAALAAHISVNLSLARTLTRSTENLKYADEALKDALSE